MWFIIFGIVFVCCLMACIIDDCKKAKRSELRFLKRCQAEGLIIPKGTIVWLVNLESLWIERYKVVDYTFKHNDPRYELKCMNSNSENILEVYNSPYLFTDKKKAVEKLNSMRINKGRNKITENDII